jgi:hypothetical protein
MWETVSDSGDVEGFLHYLQRFPEGEFAEIARDRITALPSAPPDAPGRGACPNGEFVPLAKVRLEELRQ